MTNNIINSVSDNQMNYLTPDPIKSITSADLLDYQCNDQGYDLKIDLIVDQLRDLMPDQTSDLSNNQLLDLLSIATK